MGYYSDVRCLIYGPRDQIDALVAAESMRGNAWFVGEWKGYLKRRQDLSAVMSHDSDTDVLFDALEINDNFKWRSDFTFVQQWHDLLDRIDRRELPFQIAYEFARVGDEPTDVDRGEGGEGGMLQYILRIQTLIRSDWD